MIRSTTGGAPGSAPHLLVTAGDRVRVAYGVVGRLGRVRSTSPGHLLVDYDRGGREMIDPTRRPVWVLE